MPNKILVVDDEEDLVDVLAARLSAEGYSVSTASNGTEAVRKIEEERPEVVILDVMMPEINGYQVCRFIREDAGLSGTKVIMLTAKGQQNERFWGLEAGANEYIPKPFDIKEIIGKVRMLVA